ncbi:MAG: Holliday junction resolvase RuvX [Neisseriaceae bacterium]|nr:Holliday junction resolvase RuvX [Neisseriaceae bacterium]MBP6861469.1 Holliday junction resolvase RuvX [Neisseriaceae bacterium]
MLNSIPQGTTLGFDYGEARIGVAEGDALLGIAHPIVTIAEVENDKKFAKVEALLKEWQPKQLVVGLPTHVDGTPHDMTAVCRRFAQRLNGRFRLPVYLVDERLSSVVAESLLKEAQVYGKKQKPFLDQVAAQAILTTFFESGYVDLLP